MSRLAASVVALLLIAALVAGCGSGGSSSGGSTAGGSRTAGGSAPVGAQATPCDTYAVDAEALRATGVSCKAARQTMFAWQRAHACELANGASRGACTVSGGLRCQAVRGGKGVSVSCARPGHAIAFRVKRG